MVVKFVMQAQLSTEAEMEAGNTFSFVKNKEADFFSRSLPLDFASVLSASLVSETLPRESIGCQWS